MPSVEFEGRGPARVVTLNRSETAYLTDSPMAMALGADRQARRQSEATPRDPAGSHSRAPVGFCSRNPNFQNPMTVMTSAGNR
jgi:hypothetical protein